MTNNKKQDETNKEVSFDIDNISRANKSVQIVQKKSTGWQYLNLIISPDDVQLYQSSMHEFVQLSKAYDYGTNVKFFHFACAQLHKINDYIDPPKEWLDFMTRKGRRPKGERSLPKNDSVVFYLRVSQECYDQYLSIMFNWLKDREQENNTTYSVVYFFHDFNDLVKKNIKKFVKNTK